MNASLSARRRWQRFSGELPSVYLKARPLRRVHPFLRLLSLLLLIYALLGRTGAYIGVTLGGGTGIYLGDLVLLVGLGVLILDGSYRQFFRLRVAWPWLLFFIWSAARTLPYLSEYGLLALRDGVLWGYSLFAVILSWQLTARPSGFVYLLSKYQILARYYVFWILPLLLVSLLFPGEVLGFALPGVVGTPAIIAGGLVLWPKAFGKVENWKRRQRRGNPPTNRVPLYCWLPDFASTQNRKTRTGLHVA